MKVLAVDTSQGICTVAVVENDAVLEVIKESQTSRQAEYLLIMIGQVMKNNHLSYDDLDLLVSTIGPGSFTGVRIGMTAIKGLSLVTNLPVAGVSTLQSIAKSASGNNPAQKEILAVINAMRGQLYIQKFTHDLQPKIDSELIEISQITSHINKGDIIVGNANVIVSQSVNDIDLQYIDAVPHAGDAGIIGLEYYHKHGHQDIEPLYIRPPDAKLPAKNR